MRCSECIFVVTFYYQMGQICIIPVFGGRFWSKFGYLTPGVPIYRITLHCFAINFEQTPSCFVLNVFKWLFYIIKLIKLWSYLHNTNIWGHFGQIWLFDPPECPYIGLTLTVVQLILRKCHQAQYKMRFYGYLVMLKWAK